MKLNKSKIKRHTIDLVSAIYVVYIALLFANLFVGVGDGTLRIWEAIIFLPVLLVSSWFFAMRQEYQRNFWRDPLRYSIQNRLEKNRKMVSEIVRPDAIRIPVTVRRNQRPGD